ncbi:hypothetical protein HPB47_016602, partial [Ixodes persulcatus]
SSGKQRCDAERFLGCFARAYANIIFPWTHDDKSLAVDCMVLESVDSCTKYMETGGCSDESKQRLQYLKSDFASLRSHICDPNLHTSTLEWNQCLDKSAMESCSKLLPHDHCSAYASPTFRYAIGITIARAKTFAAGRSRRIERSVSPSRGAGRSPWTCAK